MAVTPSAVDRFKIPTDAELKAPFLSMAISEWVSTDSYTVHTRKTRKAMCLHGELVDGFSGLGRVEFGQHDLHGRIVLELDDVFTSGFAEGLHGFNLSWGRHVALQVVC